MSVGVRVCVYFKLIHLISLLCALLLSPHPPPRSSSLCALRRSDLQEFGVYNLTLLANGSCSFTVDKPGVPINYGKCQFPPLANLIAIIIKNHLLIM